MAELTGTVHYLERIALPPSAEVSVELLDDSGAVVAEQTQTPGERQVPVPFSLECELDDLVGYAVRAEIRVDGRVAFRSLDDVPVLTGGQPSEVAIRVLAS